MDNPIEAICCNEIEAAINLVSGEEGTTCLASQPERHPVSAPFEIDVLFQIRISHKRFICKMQSIVWKIY